MSLFASMELVKRIESAEAQALSATVAAVTAGTFSVPLGMGVALFAGHGSPLNKLVALGFEPLAEAELAALEQRYFERGAPVQVELSTHADAALTNLLAQRGYQLTGYENVFGRPLAAPLDADPAIEVRRGRADELDLWIDTLATGFSHFADGEQAAAHDDFDRGALERVFRDMAGEQSVQRWLAFRNGQIAGAAGMSVRAGVTQLFGATTLPAQRRNGVQRALLAARLEEGRRQGGDLAVVTTQPGSASHQNVVRAGFQLLYPRAVWLKPAP